MTLIASRQPKQYRWKAGDLIDATEACAILGYKSGRNLQDAVRRKKLCENFAELDCPLTLGIYIGRELRFIRSEFDDFVQATIDKAQKGAVKKRNDLRLAA